MATSPHQTETLADLITRKKADRARKQTLLEQIETIGTTTSGGGGSTTYRDPVRLQAEIDQLDAVIASLVSQLNGTGLVQPGVALLAFVGDSGDFPATPSDS